MSDSDWGLRDKVIIGLFGLFCLIVLAFAVYATGYSKAAHRVEAQNYASQYPADTNRRWVDSTVRHGPTYCRHHCRTQFGPPVCEAA